MIGNAIANAAQVDESISVTRILASTEDFRLGYIGGMSDTLLQVENVQNPLGGGPHVDFLESLWRQAACLKRKTPRAELLRGANGVWQSNKYRMLRTQQVT